MTESEIQKWFVDQIQNQTLSETISDKSKIQTVLSSWSSLNQIPSFSVDYLMRKKCFKAADEVLNSFDCLELISDNTSISKKSGEILRPDLVCFNPEKNIIVVFELKVNALTARESMTELMAYEHEIQNHLPFLAFSDVYFVIASPEWSTLLNHSLASLNTWSDRRVLGLNIDSSSDDIILTPHIPDSWTYLRADGLPSQSFSTMNLCLYPRDNKSNSDESPIEFDTTREIICRKGEQLHTIGFLLGWENTYPNTRSKWIITIGVIQPLSFFKHAQIYGDDDRDNDLKSFLNNKCDDYILNSTQALMEIVKEAKNYLSNKWDTFSEDFADWETQREHLSQVSIPLFGDFFGELYNYALERVIQTKVMTAWTNPHFVIGLIDELTHNKPLEDGFFRCTDLFKIGSMLSKCSTCKGNIEDNKGYLGQKIWIGKYEWEKAQFLHTVQEIIELTHGVPNLVPLSLSDKPHFEEILEIFSSWFRRCFLDEFGDEIHKAIFLLGTQIGVFLDSFTDGVIDYESLTDEWHNGSIANTVANVIKLAFDPDKYNSSYAEEIQFLRKVLKENNIEPNIPIALSIKHNGQTTVNSPIIKEIEKHLLPLIDLIVMPVPLRTLKGTLEVVDWDYLKDGAIKLFESGDKFPTLVFKANGILGIQPGEELLRLKILQPVTNPNESIYFMDEFGDRKMAILSKWNEIMEIIKNYDTQPIQDSEDK
ncbi:MAG: hypothetical protein GX639_05455 [Fibrobacter sp.]|nr:hypothetical protein [Fibrobacter sp.]